MLQRMQGRLFSAVCLMIVFVWAAAAAQVTTPPLSYENNFFVSGDYVVAGWANKQADPNRAGYAIGTISVPDQTQIQAVQTPQAGVQTQVPAGADIVGAWLYWTTVEKAQTPLAGQVAYFTPSGHPTYQLTATQLQASSPVSWSAGGCAGSSMGTTRMNVYRADVRGLLPVDSNGVVRPNTAYTLELADSGSNGSTVPFSLGATLVIVYRVLSPNVPLTAVVIYDGAYAPSNSGDTMTQRIEGFYQPSASRIAKITHIVGNGQTKKSETVSLNGVTLPPLYGANPPFPGLYNGDWDNPTWNVSSYLTSPPNDNADSTTVSPSASNSGCVSWGAIIFSTTVQDSDGDGLLDYWEAEPGPLNPVNPTGSSPGYNDVATGQFVALPGANPNQKDIFVQLDGMCSGTIVTNPDSTSTCSTTNGGVSFLPPSDALTMMRNAFAAKGINLHSDIRNAIPEQTCEDTTDSSGNPVYCIYPHQPGVVTWKAGFNFLKNQPLNYPDGASCETRTPPGGTAGTGPACIRRFQPARKDSYHYLLAANALGGANWSFQGSLSSIAVAGSGVATFYTTAPPGRSAANPTGVVANDATAPGGRVTVLNAASNPSLNGVYFVTSVSNTPPYGFTVQTTNVPTGTYTLNTDPYLWVASGQGSTASGYSDVGGEDSLIALGLWGPDGQTVNVQAGTMMHELGHTLALTHGGYYYDTPNSYVPAVGANCKPNFQSIMNYLFQVDLLDNGVLDYSEQALNPLDETLLPTGLTASDGTGPAYATTKWYAPDAPVGSPATRHCDGSLILPTDPDPTMYRLEGTADPIAPAWVNDSDINFNGQIDSMQRGYNDWANIDLRQMGAAGSLSSAIGLSNGGTLALGSGGTLALGSGGTLALGSGGTLALGSGGTLALGSGGTLALGSGGTLALGSGGTLALGSGGVGSGEIDFATANSVVRPPRYLNATLNGPPLSVTLNWTQPTFGQIGSYKVYRGVNGATPTLYTAVTGTSYTDLDIKNCTSYVYFVTAILAADGRESVPSNSVTVNRCNH